MPFSVRSSARWHEAIALSCAASELFRSKFAQRERPAIPDPALSCLCRRKRSQFLGLPKKFASGSTRASQINGKSHHLGPPAAYDILRTESKLSDRKLNPLPPDPDHHQLSAIAHSSPEWRPLLQQAADVASWGGQCPLTDAGAREICSSRIRASRRAPSKIERGSTAAKPTTKPLRRGRRCECPYSGRSSMLALAAAAAAARSSIRALSRTAVSRPDSILGITRKSLQWISAACCSASERS